VCGVANVFVADGALSLSCATCTWVSAMAEGSALYRIAGGVFKGWRFECCIGLPTAPPRKPAQKGQVDIYIRLVYVLALRNMAVAIWKTNRIG